MEGQDERCEGATANGRPAPWSASSGPGKDVNGDGDGEEIPNDAQVQQGRGGIADGAPAAL